MTDRKVIDRLGGTKAVAEALDIFPSAVTNWRKRGISEAGRYQIRDLAKRKRVTLPADFMTRKPKKRKV